MTSTLFSHGRLFAATLLIGLTCTWSVAVAADCGVPAKTFCPNKVVQYHAVATASSTATTVSFEPPNAVWGTRRKGNEQSFWASNTAQSFPQWLKATWTTAQTIDRIVVRQPTWNQPGAPSGPTMVQSRVQFWNLNTEQWEDVVPTGIGQANPILNWQLPLLTADGSEVRVLDFSQISTTAIRYYVDQGAGTSYASLEEIEAYDIDSPECNPDDTVNVATPTWTTDVTASQTYGGGPAGVANVMQNVQDDSPFNPSSPSYSPYYWMSEQDWTWPDWIQLTFQQPIKVSKIGLRMPNDPMRQARLQYWDDTQAMWVNFTAPNLPIVNWAAPSVGGEWRKEFTFPTVTTSKVRLVVDLGSPDGTTKLEEFQVYGPNNLTT